MSRFLVEYANKRKRKREKLNRTYIRDDVVPFLLFVPGAPFVSTQRSLLTEGGSKTRLENAINNAFVMVDKWLLRSMVNNVSRDTIGMVLI